jgi:hypothetical protein
MTTKPVEQIARELLAAELSNALGRAVLEGKPAGHITINIETALRAIIAALNTDEERIRRLEEAVKLAAVTFDSYATMHFAKIRGDTPPVERAVILDKVRRNKEHADALREALSTPSKEVGR